MRTIQILLAAATAALTLSPAASTLAQTPGGADYQNIDPQALQDRIAQFATMSPQQQQEALQQFQNSSPQQQMAVIQQFRNLSPQQQQAAMEQLQKIDPELITNLVQRRIENSLREQLGVTNDDEWTVIEQKIAAVLKARTALMAYGGGAMGGSDGNRGFPGASGHRSPEAQELKRAVDSDAAAEQIRSGLDKYRTGRKEKQAALVKAQDELRALLSFRQEAIAVARNLLD